VDNYSLGRARGTDSGAPALDIDRIHTSIGRGVRKVGGGASLTWAQEDGAELKSVPRRYRPKPLAGEGLASAKQMID
jgi:hypothetical protein